MRPDEDSQLGNLIFEIEGPIQEYKGEKTLSHLSFYENGFIVREMGGYLRVLKSNISNIYYSAPMVGDYKCVTIEIDYYNKGKFNIYPLDEATWKGISKYVDRLLDSQWNDLRRPKTSLPDNVKWFNAVNAVTALASEGDPELFGSDVKTAESTLRCQKTLLRSWNVNTKQNLLDWFDRLYAGYSAEQGIEMIEELKEEGFNPDDLSEGYRNELAWLQSKNSLAWDLGRIIWIASLGYLADLLTYEEAINNCANAGKKLQSLFHSWDDMFLNYMRGYIYGFGDDPKNPHSEAYQRLRIYYWLHTLPRSPYRIDWNTKL